MGEVPAVPGTVAVLAMLGCAHGDRYARTLVRAIGVGASGTAGVFPVVVLTAANLLRRAQDGQDRDAEQRVYQHMLLLALALRDVLGLPNPFLPQRFRARPGSSGSTTPGG